MEGHPSVYLFFSVITSQCCIACKHVVLFAGGAFGPLEEIGSGTSEDSVFSLKF